MVIKGLNGILADFARKLIVYCFFRKINRFYWHHSWHFFYIQSTEYFYSVQYYFTFAFMLKEKHSFKITVNSVKREMGK